MLNFEKLADGAWSLFKTAGFNHSPIPPIPILPDFIRPILPDLTGKSGAIRVYRMTFDTRIQW